MAELSHQLYITGKLRDIIHIFTQYINKRDANNVEV